VNRCLGADFSDAPGPEPLERIDRLRFLESQKSEIVRLLFFAEGDRSGRDFELAYWF
jgi:hypothetical protein